MTTPKDLKDMLAQREALDQQIIDAQRQLKADAVAQCRALMAEHGLTLADLGGRTGGQPRRGPGHKVAPKYRHPDSGETWSGRGLQPRWLKAALDDGGRIEDFKV